MATKKCPNGHQYDSSIYGDNCPFCPSGHTHVNNDSESEPRQQWLMALVEQQVRLELRHR